MLDALATTNNLLANFRLRREVQVAGYEKITFCGHAGSTLRVASGRNPYCNVAAMRVLRAVDLVRRNPNIYNDAPRVSHDSGAGHVSVMVWSILHLMTLEQLLA